MSIAVLFDEPGPVARRRQRIGGIIGSIVVLAILGFIAWRLWSKGQITGDKWQPFSDPDIVRGLWLGLLATLRAALFSVVLAVALGAVLASGRLSEHGIVRWPAVVVIEFFRAIPLLLLILFIFLGFGSTIGTFWSLVSALVLYNGSVLAEIFRAGIHAVPKGQSEAAYALGMRKSQVMTIVLIPQAVRTMLPAIVSQCVVALKDTSLGFVIGYEELVRTGRLVYDGYFNIIAVGLVLMAIYVTINYSLSRLAVWLEGRQRRSGGTVLEPDFGTESATL